MLRPVDATPLSEPGLRTFGAVRPDGGSGEKASTESLEQSSIAVRQAAVVALGTGTRETAGAEARPAVALYSRPPGAASDASRASEAGEMDGVAEAADAAQADGARYLRRADGVYYSSSGEVLVATTPITEQTLQKLVRMREAVLSPPTSPEDLQIAARASLDIQRAQLELATSRYTTAAAEPAKSPSIPPPSTTNVTA